MRIANQENINLQKVNIRDMKDGTKFGIGWLGAVLFGLGWFGLGWFGLGWFGIGWFGIDWFGIG
jgi:hypothetical protein